MSGIELFALQMARRVREHNEEVDRINAENERLNPLTINTNTLDSKKVKPASPQSPISTLVICTLILLAAAFIGGILAALFAAPYVAVFAVINGLTAVTFAVLSLRETS